MMKYWSIFYQMKQYDRNVIINKLLGGGALGGSYIRVESTGILILLYRPFFFFKIDHDALDGESG